MDTKLKGDIAETAAVLEAQKREWGVLVPIGDRLPYDLVFVVGEKFYKIQVKSAWYERTSQNYVVGTQRSKTNRRVIKCEGYSEGDFDFALLYIEEKGIFYIMPFDVFTSYASRIGLVESSKRQRKPKSWSYREAWDLIS